ncbi:MAG: DUF3310 domain-containing protein [Peptostreptococcus anaerobius]|uniref:DUF3310 domain-containing protein n=1 Tax=Peptostreptococcus anaerobius TaxID=1261 RepID=UPI0029048757|nr:DUF3310 domain-containing protein [Peptostreptococcus anaerobius]MDU0963595.1 DUF3310 domain-containing protein [Peptostreptococcus anaerobius]MDU0997483.1 DUF3310 domain-containing protein [Peptostreptococcus anaerobius]
MTRSIISAIEDLIDELEDSAYNREDVYQINKQREKISFALNNLLAEDESDNSNIRPNHYKLTGLFKEDGEQAEVLDVIKAALTDEEYRGFLKGNEIKYILREKHKNGVEDLKKNGQYNKWLIEHDEVMNNEDR